MIIDYNRITRQLFLFFFALVEVLLTNTYFKKYRMYNTYSQQSKRIYRYIARENSIYYCDNEKKLISIS